MTILRPRGTKCLLWPVRPRCCRPYRLSSCGRAAQVPPSHGLLAPVVYTWYTYSVCHSRGAGHECLPCSPRPLERETEIRHAAAERDRGADGRGLAAERRAGLHDAAAP